MSNEQVYADRMEKTAFKVLKIIGMVVLGLFAASMLGFVVKWLWNWLMTDIFGLAEITYWQGVGIFILGRILLGGFGGGSSSSSNSSESPRGVIKQAIHEEMQDNFKKEFREKYKECEEEIDIEVQDKRQENAQTEAMYDQWWDEEGEKLFAEFLEKDKPSE